MTNIENLEIIRLENALQESEAELKEQRQVNQNLLRQVCDYSFAVKQMCGLVQYWKREAKLFRTKWVVIGYAIATLFSIIFKYYLK